MKRHRVGRRWIALAAVLLAGGAVVWLVLTPPAERITTRASSRIETGMTRARVEELLGGPAGDYRTPPFRPADVTFFDQRPLPPGDCWQGNSHSVYVSFDARDTVTSVTGFYPGPLRSSFYRSLQEWLPLPD